MAKVAIVDYGVGNLLSVSRAIRFNGHDAYFVETPEQIEKAGIVVLPGVGAFSDAMGKLRNQELDIGIIKHAKAGKPLLGICLGMQMLFDTSEEFGSNKGLSLVPGKVKEIPRMTADGKQRLIIPHIGWQALEAPSNMPWTSKILNGIAPATPMYFVHSYVASPTHSEHCVAVCNYGGHALTSVVEVDNIIGCQFHPEKSAEKGLKLLDNLASIC